jgi:hypothetical protein
MFLIDGMTNYGFVGNYAVEPIVDTIQEFKVQSHNDIAAYGGVLGGIVNVVSKGGTREYRGEAWEFFRNSAMDARNTFLPGVTPFKQNQFGAVFGGPLKVPGLSKSEPKTFFYGGYEGFRSSRAAQVLSLVPTSAQLGGDLSSASTPIYNPFSTREDPSKPGQFIRDPIPGNRIPGSLISQGLVGYAKAFYPQPIGTAIPNVNNIDTTPNRTRLDTGSMRLDHQFSDNLNSFFRFIDFDQNLTSATGLSGVQNTQALVGYQMGGALTYSFGQGTKVATGRFSRTDTYALVGKNWGSISENAWKNFGFSTLYAGGFTGGRSFNPGMNITGYQSVVGGNIQGNQTADTWQVAGDFSIVKGKHTLQMGVDINTNNNVQPIQFVNQTYIAFQTGNPSSPAGTGDALASYLMGLPSSTNRRNVYISTHGGWVNGFYIQDQWQASRKLHINLGFRYDVTLWPIYGDKHDNNLYAGDTNLDTGQYILTAVPPKCGAAPCIPTSDGSLPAHVVATTSNNNSIIHNTYDNWQPRIGLAYRLRDKTVIRASAGRFFDNWAAVQQLATNYQGAWPDVAFLLANNLNTPTPGAVLPNAPGLDPFNLGSSGQILPPPTPFNQVNWMIDPYYKNAYSIQWNFGIQEQLDSHTVVEMDYVGSHTLRTDSGAYRNTALTPGPGNPSARQPYPYITPTYFDKSIAKAGYNSFQFKARRTTSTGLSVLTSYTFSKAVNEGCDNFFGSEGCSIQDPYHLSLDRGVAGFDITHLFSTSFVYELPVGKGKRLQPRSRIVNFAAAGWSLNGILTARSGRPFHANASGDIANTGGVVERADVLCTNPYTTSRGRQFLNTSCFATPALYTFGNSGRNNLRSNHVTNFDLSLFKVFPIPKREKMNLEFRAEFFNSLNASALNVPVITVSDPNFGRVTSTAQSERDIQLALKLRF